MRNDVQIVLAIALMLGWQAHLNGMDNAAATLSRKFVILASKGYAFVAPAQGPWVTPDAFVAPSGRLAAYYAIAAKLAPPAASLEHCAKTGSFNADELQQLRERGTVGLNRFRQTLVSGVAPLSAQADASGFPQGSLWIDTAPDDADTREVPVIVHLHGGGGVAGSPRRESGYAYKLASRSGYRVLLLAYPLAPEAHSTRGQAVADAILKLHNENPRRHIVLSSASAGDKLQQRRCVARTLADTFSWQIIQAATRCWKRYLSCVRVARRALSREPL